MTSRLSRSVVTLILSAVCSYGASAAPRAPGTLPLAGVRESSRVISISPRPRLPLNGQWQFQKEGEVAWRTARIPASWQVSFPDLRDYTGSAVYKKTVRIPADWRQHTWIVFGAVDYAARVVVNDRYVGLHEGGYTPFAFDLHDYVTPGETAVIALNVTDSGPNGSAEGYPFDEIPHGKQSWYGNVSGPWQPVYLEQRAATHVKSLRVTPDLSRNTAVVDVSLSQVPPGASGTLYASVYAPGGAPVAEVKVALSSALQYTFTVPIRTPELWTPDNPKLYTINTSLVTEGGSVVDDHAERFGMRSIETRDGKILLNGKPVFLAGVLDQDFYPHTHYTVPSEEYLRDQFDKAKRLGINLLRCHIKIPDPVYLHLADEMGLLVWYDLPNPAKLTPKSRARMADTLRDTVTRDYNHPSLVIISLFNESWGIDLKNVDQRKWLVSFYDYARNIAPGRLIVDNSACHGNFHIKTDIDDFHCYKNIPDHAQEWAEWVKDFASRPAWSFSGYGDALRTGEEPLMVSEFGNWGLPSVPLLRECYEGELPWWFGSRSGHLQPDGVEKRFSDLGLDLVFGDFGRFARATQQSQLLAFKWQIEEMRKYPQIAGYCWTELTDVQWEANGLLDFCRNVKASGRAAALVQKDRCVFTRLERHSGRSGEDIRGRLWVSNFGDQIGGGSTIEWQLDGFPEVTGTASIDGNVASPDAFDSGAIAFTVPEVNTSRSSRLLIRWFSEGRELASNYEDVYLFPAADGGQSAQSFYLDDSLVSRDALAAWLKERGASVTSILSTADIAVTAKWTPRIASWSAEGGRVLLLAEDESCAGPVGAKLSIKSRKDKGRWGDWATSFTWLAERSMFLGIPSRSRTLDWAFEHMIPSCVIEGVGDSIDWDDVQSGLFVGWAGSPAAVVMRAGSENSRVILCTFPAGREAGRVPAASVLLWNMINDLSSPAFYVEGDPGLF